MQAHEEHNVATEMPDYDSDEFEGVGEPECLGRCDRCGRKLYEECDEGLCDLCVVLLDQAEELGGSD